MTPVNEIGQSASKVCNALKQFLKYQIDRKSLEIIYFTFIRPKFEHACQVWIAYTGRDEETLEVVQLNAAPVITGARKGISHILHMKTFSI